MAIQQGTITITGFVATEPLRIGREEHNPVCTFRMASTRGYFHVRRNQWEERATTWMTVKAYKALAANVLQSVHKGQPIVVNGILETEEWTDKHGDHQSAVIIEASCIGHHLGLGVSSFTRKRSRISNHAEEQHVTKAEEHKLAVIEGQQQLQLDTTANFEACNSSPFMDTHSVAAPVKQLQSV